MNNGYEPPIFRPATTLQDRLSHERSNPVSSLKAEVHNSALTEDEFAASLGVDVLRLRYWLELETYRAALTMCAQLDRRVPDDTAARPV